MRPTRSMSATTTPAMTKNVTDPNRAIDEDEIGVVLNPGEKDTDNNFVDSNNGAITGTVQDDNGNPISGVPIQL